MPGFALSLPVPELVEDVVQVVEDFCSHPLLRDLMGISVNGQDSQRSEGAGLSFSVGAVMQIWCV